MVCFRNSIVATHFEFMMASLNSLPDLSTVDLKAIQDSEPVHPRFALPPLTTIAENWESVEPNVRSQIDNERSSGSEEETSDDELKCENTPLKTKKTKPVTASYSSGSMANSGHGTSDSELSDFTTDSGSSTSDSDSESASLSSASSCENQDCFSKWDRNNFSIREANYEKGRVTLRLSTLQLEKHDISTTAVFAQVTKPHEHPNNPTATLNSQLINCISAKNSLNPSNFPVINQKHKGNNTEQTSIPSSQLKPSKCSANQKSPEKEPGIKLERPLTVKTTSKVSLQTNESRTSRKKGVSLKSLSKKNGCTNTMPSGNEESSRLKNSLNPILSGSKKTDPCLSDIDSDNDELVLPAVSEAIRMLDLDSQSLSAGQQVTSNLNAPASSFGLSFPRLPFALGCSGFLNQNPWPSIGYCSSLLQQFVAKSQLGEPPPPPPITQLPTKGARKCFALNDEQGFSCSDHSTKQVADFVRHNGLSTASSSHVEQDTDTVVPMKGLDCHVPHVSPDSGIQSVSGSPFSAHSSPVHPSTSVNSFTGHQTTALVPQHSSVRSPSPWRKEQKKSRKSGSNKNARLMDSSSKDKKNASDFKSTNSPKSTNTKGPRRPRSCRDTASALSSGIAKDSSIVQAIHQGMNAALRLTNSHFENHQLSSSKESTQIVSSTEGIVRPEKCKKSESRFKQKTKPSTRQNPIPLAGISEDSNSQPNSAIEPNLEVKSSNLFTLDRAEKSESISNSDSKKEARHKKKKKRHKNDHRDYTQHQVDPRLQPLLEHLCSRFDRCTISKSSSTSTIENQRKRPFIFDIRKYTFGSLTSSTIGSIGRSKRRKLEEEHGLQINRTITGLKRRGKTKKCQIQLTAPTVKNSSVENEPTVAAAAAAVVLTAVELLLPLKKRHHHLPTSDCQIAEAGADHPQVCDLASVKPSQDSSSNIQALQPLYPSTSTRKRSANHETGCERLEPVDETGHQAPSSSLSQTNRSRGRKKPKLEDEGVSEVVIRQTEGTKNEVQMVDSSPDQARIQISDLKKRNRRRKAINRTGFPSVKKKRKKPLITPKNNNCSGQEVLDNKHVESSHVKKSRSALRKSSEQSSLPDPANSEAVSSDELSTGQAPVTEEINQPKKRKGLNSLRKRYLPAGLLSNYFKEENEVSASNQPGSVPGDRSKATIYDPEEHEHGLLPPPYYCEKIVRRKKRDFQLPYDIWWLHQQGKLPNRDCMVPSWNYRKIRTNVYYDVKPPYSNDAQACNCTLPSSDSKDSETQCCGEDCLNRMVYTECSPQLCPVGEKCTNQQIQRHRWAQGLERFMTKEKGWGVRCRNPIKAGQFILEYVGEVVSDKEFKERMHTIYVHDTHHYCLHLDGGLVIDGHRMGGDGRFVNHSCAPNCEMQKWSVNGLPRMALFSMRDIDALEELSYDYNFSLFNPAEGQPCKCGSGHCRGVIGGKSQRVVPATDVNGAKQPMKIVQQKRKRKTHKHGRTSLSACTAANSLRPLSMQQRSFVLHHRCFLLRNLDKVREWRDRQKDRIKLAQQQNNVGRARRFTSRPTSTRLEKQVNTENEHQTPISADLAVAIPQQNPLLYVEEDASCDEEIVRCRCRLFDDEGLMVQCEKCETWQHSDCLGHENAKIALETEHYVCNDCLGNPTSKENLDILLVPQPDNPPEGLTFYLSLYYKNLHLRQGDCVYVLRDHDTPDSEKTLWASTKSLDDFPTPRPPRELPPHIKVLNLDIFQIERLWIDEKGNKFVWGHHFFRPQDTYHEPSRKFYVNEVLHSPITEAIPAWAVAGRCWVLDPATFCKGRPSDAVEEHVYICEYRVDRTARLFSKNARTKFPLCTRGFAFKNFITRLKPQRTFQPHALPVSNSRKPSEPLPSSKSNKSKNSIESKTKASEKQQKSSSTKPGYPNENDERRNRLEGYLHKLLSKNAKPGEQVEDATHLLHRGRGRVRGRPAKSKSRISGPIH